MNVEHTRSCTWKGFSFHRIFYTSPPLLQLKLQLISLSLSMNRLTDRNHPIANSGKGMVGRYPLHPNTGILDLLKYYWRTRILGT